MIRITVWAEENCFKNEHARAVYPDGIHRAIASFLEKDAEFEVKAYSLDDEEYGLSESILENTDVLIWWAHFKHHLLPDEVAERVKGAVQRGMGVIFLHSAHLAKPFKLLTGSSCTLGWREQGDHERLWAVCPSHPIAQGIDKYIDIPHDETYSEPFGIPEPDELVFIGWFDGGEVFRSGACYKRDNGKIFYFQPGHETFPVFYQEEIQQVIKNAVRWAKPVYRVQALDCPNIVKNPPIIK